MSKAPNLTIPILFILIITAPLCAEGVLDLWNVDSIVDPSWMDVETLWVADTSILNPLGIDLVDLRVGEIRFSSFGGDSGTLRIQAFFAYPTFLSNMPGFVINHGIIMDGELEMAETFSAGLACFALAISAPGHGTSTGGSAYHLPNLVRSYPDPRNNHFYQFAYATMRGITYMEHLPMIDTDWLCALGFSGGADAAFIANGVDSRMSFCVPIIPQTDFECGAADSGWIIDIFSESGYTLGDSNTTFLQRYIAPINYVEFLHGWTVLIVGSQDEFEPLDCVNSIYGALDGTNARLEIVANFDHHCYYTPYGLTVDYESFDNTDTFYGRILGTTNSILTLLRTGIPVPQIPTLSLDVEGDSIVAVSNVPASFWVTDDVVLWFSTDSAWTFQSVPMIFDIGPPSLYKVSFPNVPEYALDNLICFVEAKSAPFLWLSSRPYVPEDMSFRIRPFPWLFFGLGIGESSIRPRDMAITAYPNPFNSAISISVKTLHATSLRIEIFDINGRIVYDNSVGDGSPVPSANGRGDLAPTEIVWRPAPTLPSGVYFVQARFDYFDQLTDRGDAEITKRIVYLK